MADHETTRGSAPDATQAGGADGKGKERKAAVKPHQRILKHKGFIPTVVVIVLVAFVLASPRMAGSPPRLDSISPTRGKTGIVMILSGRSFGSARETSEVRIAGVSPTSRDYQEWTDNRISVTIPEEARSGIVYVITRSGRSRGLLFINDDDIPHLASSSGRPGEPYINTNTDNPIQPPAARVGDEITILGQNFGLERGISAVYFTWTGQQEAAGGSLDVANMLPARDYNLDYISWSDREIRLHVPDGAASGNVIVQTDKGQSNAAYFVVNKGAGSKSYGTPRKYSVEYALDVKVTAAAGENTLYLWMPRILPSPEQKIEAMTQDPPPLLETTDADLHSLSNLSKGSNLRLSRSWMFDRYEVETQVNPAAVPTYDTSADLFKLFTAADALVPSLNAEVIKAAKAAVGSEKNPWREARMIYDWLLSQLSFSQSAADTLGALKSRRGDAFVYSSLYCALLRASGIPSRMVSGYLIKDSGQPTRRHFWDEFYVGTLGWVPVDPLLADESSLIPGVPTADFDPRAYYFGNLDNQHVTFTKGLEVVRQMDPTGRTTSHVDRPYLFSIQEEALGGLTGYETSFEDLKVIGAY